MSWMAIRCWRCSPQAQAPSKYLLTNGQRLKWEHHEWRNEQCTFFTSFMPTLWSRSSHLCLPLSILLPHFHFISHMTTIWLPHDFCISHMVITWLLYFPYDYHMFTVFPIWLPHLLSFLPVVPRGAPDGPGPRGVVPEGRLEQRRTDHVGGVHGA